MIGSMLGPQFIYLKDYWQPAPYAAGAVASLFSLLLGYFILPETRGRPLPDTLLNVKQMETGQAMGGRNVPLLPIARKPPGVSIDTT